MLRQGIRRALPNRNNWRALQEYAIGETSQEEFRQLCARDAVVSGLITSQKATQKPIDWDAWDDRVSNKQVLQCLKDFHTQQTALLDGLLKEDHLAAVQGQTAGWELFDTAVESCKQSVEKSETILKNGARALWISFQNPPISLLSQSEWLDSDQYWQAFVEKHQFYHNHIASVVEDPESKEYDQKNKTDMIKKWEVFDGRGTTRQNNKLLYQRPSFEYYDLFRGIFVEHMVYYLVKTGGDARFFPETMPAKWYGEIYDTRFKVYNVLQRRKRMVQEAGCLREVQHDFHPHDLDHDGEAHFSKLIAKDAAMTEFTMARLMGNYILFSDSYVPVQTGMAFYKAIQMDDGAGTFYSLGGDVSCLFYKPAGGALATPEPKECFHALGDYVSMSGRRFEAGYAAALDAFTDLLETRKEGLGGHWLTVPGETSKEAFLRRLKTADPARAIYEAYAAEHSERWAEAKALTMEQALAEIPGIEQKYKLECEAYSSVLFGLNEDLTASAKLEQEQVAKLAEVGKLQPQLDSSALVAIEGPASVRGEAAVSGSIEEFDAQKDKSLDAVMATKVTLK